jgi:hypothetical protein
MRLPNHCAGYLARSSAGNNDREFHESFLIRPPKFIHPRAGQEEITLLGAEDPELIRWPTHLAPNYELMASLCTLKTPLSARAFK